MRACARMFASPRVPLRDNACCLLPNNTEQPATNSTRLDLPFDVRGVGQRPALLQF